jgi:hypothetical protein
MENGTKAQSAAQVLADVCVAMIETIEEMGVRGVPGGHLYAMLMSRGCNLETFEIIMGAVCRTGRVVKRGQCYFPTNREKVQ